MPSMTSSKVDSSIDEYLRKRLMPVEGTIPQLRGIDMYGNSIPVGTVGGDLFEYLNFQQRYNIDARIAQALRLSEQYLEPLREGQTPRNPVDDHIQWLKSKPGYTSAQGAEYRHAKSSEQLRVAEVLKELYTTAGVLLVDAQGHGIISAKIASTGHSGTHASQSMQVESTKKSPGTFSGRRRAALAISQNHPRWVNGNIDISHQ